MPNSYTTYWCPSCEKLAATKNRWAHGRTKLHKRNAQRRFPRPENPWAPSGQIIQAAETLPHLTYLQKPSKT